MQTRDWEIEEHKMPFDETNFNNKAVRQTLLNTDFLHSEVESIKIQWDSQTRSNQSNNDNLRSQQNGKPKEIQQEDSVIHISFDGKTEVIDKPKSTSETARPERKPEIQIAEILGKNSDFGNPVRRERVEKLLSDAVIKGPEETKRLVDSINAQLKRNGSELKIESHEYSTMTPAQRIVHDTGGLMVYRYPDVPATKRNYVGFNVLNKHGEKEDYMSVFRNEEIKSSILFPPIKDFSPNRREPRTPTYGPSDKQKIVPPGYEAKKPHE